MAENFDRTPLTGNLDNWLLVGSDYDVQPVKVVVIYAVADEKEEKKELVRFDNSHGSYHRHKLYLRESDGEYKLKYRDGMFKSPEEFRDWAIDCVWKNFVEWRREAQKAGYV